jgi:hypothetical protein
MDINEQGKLGRRSLIVGSAALLAAGVGAVPADAAVRPRRRVDFARWDPIDGRSTVALAPQRVVMHIAATRARDIYGPQKGPFDSYAHFYNRRSGVPLQHQWLNRRAAAELDGSASSISVEHQGVEGDRMTDSQLTYLARIFAWSHVHLGVPNRIATPRNTTGLAWHRLGVAGNFGAFDRSNRKTWCRRDTGEEWSSSVKTCPTDKFIDQVDDVFRIAQIWIRLYQNG